MTTTTQIAEAPAHNLPKWKECERVIESQNETPLDRFIYEYDDSDGFRSDWFMHRLELVIEDARKQARTEQSTEIAELKAKLADAMDALKKYDELIKHNYSGTQDAMSDLTYAAQNGHSVLLKLLKD